MPGYGAIPVKKNDVECWNVFTLILYENLRQNFYQRHFLIRMPS